MGSANDVTNKEMWNSVVTNLVRKEFPKLEPDNFHEEEKSSLVTLCCCANVAMTVGAQLMNFEGKPRLANAGKISDIGADFMKQCREYPLLGLKVAHDIATMTRTHIWAARKTQHGRWIACTEGSPTDIKRRKNLVYLELLYDTLNWLAFGALHSAEHLTEKKEAGKEDWIQALRTTCDTLHTVGLQLRAAADGIKEDGVAGLSASLLRT